MSPETMLQEYRQAQDKSIVMAFKGALSQTMLVDLGNILRNKVGFDGKAKKMFSVFIELTQNIKNYSAETELELPAGKQIGVGIVVVSDAAEQYTVTAGNLMPSANVERVRSRCEYIKTMSYEQLRAFHKEKMREGPPPDSKGAGLGLIDIAMKANTHVDFDFQSVNSNYTFFTINACIKKG